MTGERGQHGELGQKMGVKGSEHVNGFAKST